MTSCCPEFDVTIHTSPGDTCGTFNHLWLSLIGSLGETPPIIANTNQHLLPGSTCQVSVPSNGPLGQLVLVRLRLEIQPGFPDVNWHCSKVEVRQRAGVFGAQVFLCDRWLRTADSDVELRSGKLCLMADESEEKLKQHRLKQLKQQQQLIRWRHFVDGGPQCVDLNSMAELGPNLCYTPKTLPPNVYYLKGFGDRSKSWSGFSELETIFAHTGDHNSVARLVKTHWKDDWYFGYQCLNGCNPLLIRQIHQLPPKLAVNSDMLRPFLPKGSSLKDELKKGNVYLLDYELLDGLPANLINGKQTYLPAPLCLLHLNQQKQLIPIAIQLLQNPGPQNPVFLPSDSGPDWLLAKMWVHCADFQHHQVVSHYLRAHMMAELGCVATLRQLPEQHPLHQLLMPHLRMSLQINFHARAALLSPNGTFDQAVGAGLKAIPILLSRASAKVRYRSLCVPDDALDRGLKNLPLSYYTQDALRVWDALHRFVSSWVDLYYKVDKDVQNDSELQNWVDDIVTHSFPENSGFPQSFSTKAEVCKFVTMFIYSCSALHAVVNFSQLDFALWMPNCPSAMMKPPPQVKGQLKEDDIMSFLPDVNAACRVLTTLTVLSQPAADFIPLCHYKEAIFTVDAHRRLLDQVQAELKVISHDITERNKHLKLPYPLPVSPSHREQRGHLNPPSSYKPAESKTFIST